MAAPLLNRWRWPLLALLAVALLLAAALTGERQSGLTAFKPAGLMLAIAPTSIDEIVVSTGERRWQFSRRAGQWTAGTPPLPVPASTAEQLDAGLLLLHNSAPERFIGADEARDLARYGLAPPLLTVSLRGAAPFAIEFGGTNPLGTARYARLPDQAAVAILPAFVADTWEQAVGLR